MYIVLYKGGIPAAPSDTATLLRLNTSYRFYLGQLLTVIVLRHTQLPLFDGRCVQGPGTYSPLPADQRLLAIPTSRSRVADSYLY